MVLYSRIPKWRVTITYGGTSFPIIAQCLIERNGTLWKVLRKSIQAMYIKGEGERSVKCHWGAEAGGYPEAPQRNGDDYSAHDLDLFASVIMPPSVNHWWNIVPEAKWLNKSRSFTHPSIHYTCIQKIIWNVCFVPGLIFNEYVGAIYPVAQPIPIIHINL